MKAVIYSRVSTIEKQDNQRQIEDLKRYAVYKKLEVAETFEDKVSGATSAKIRLGFNRMSTYIKQNKIKHILVSEISRLGRNQRDVIDNIEKFTIEGICLHIQNPNLQTIKDDGTEDPMTSIVISLLSGFADMERRYTKNRVISGLRNAVATGKAGGGKLMPYGFKKDSQGFLVPDKEESKVVKQLFEMYLKGYGTKRLASFLNGSNVPTRTNGKWRDGTIYGLLTNPIYKGKRQYKDEEFDVEPIIHEMQFDNVQKELRKNGRKLDINRKYEFIFQKLIICGKCGKKYYMHKRKDNKDNAYKCLSRRYNESCGNPSINIDKFNNAIYHLLNNEMWLYTFGQNNTSNDRIKKLDEQKEVYQKELDGFTNEFNTKDREIDNLISLSMKVRDTDRVSKKINALDEEKVKLSTKILDVQEKLESIESIRLTLTNFNKVDTSNVDIFKSYISDLIVSITITEILDKGLFEELYTNKQDSVVHLHIKTVTGGNSAIVLSQRTPFMLLLEDADFDNLPYTDFHKIDIPKVVSIDK